MSFGPFYAIIIGQRLVDGDLGAATLHHWGGAFDNQSYVHLAGLK